MSDQEFTALLQKTARLAAAHFKAQAELTEAFRERYGCSYSDVDCDQLIECLDLNGGGRLNATKADEMMADCNAPKLL